MSRYGPKKRTAKECHSALVLALYQYRPQMLAGLSVEQLMSRHGCDRKTTQYELMIAQQKRAAE